MATLIRATYSHWSSTDPKLDKVTNTVFFERETAPLPVDYDALATDILAAFNQGATSYARGSDRQSVKLYNMNDPLPRAPKAEKTSSINTGVAGPREVALVLGFRGELNAPRKRGRIYLGPFEPAEMQARPSQGIREAVAILAQRLGNIGGTDVDFVVFSPTTITAGGSVADATTPVKYAWVDDAWDTQRSRGLEATTRSAVGLDE